MDRRELESLALEHLDAVYRLAVHLTRDPNEARELVREVYARALRPRSVEGFTPGAAGFRPWLFAIAHQAFFSRGRGKTRSRPAHEVDTAPAERPPEEPPPAWDRVLLDGEQADGRLSAAIDGLSGEHRELLLLWGAERLTYGQIAEIVGLPVGTTMSRLHLARRLIADRLAEGGAADSPQARRVDAAHAGRAAP